MPILTGGADVRLMCGGHKVARIYCQGDVVYSAGSVVTYHVDSGVTYQEEVDEGESCLDPKTFAPTKAGWTFVGWRQDGAASGSVLGSLAMGDGPVELYAVFSLPVTVSYYNGNATKNTTSGYRYYNNGSVANPSFTLTQAALGGWTARGWSTTNAGNAAITYNNGATFTRDSDITLYGLYQQTITLSYSGNGNTGGSTAAQTGMRYYAPAGYINPSFTIKANGFARTGYTFAGWGYGSILYLPGNSITLSANLALSAQWVQTAAYNFGYTGGAQSWVCPANGIYQLTVYGAAGGTARTDSGATAPGGAGGMATGTVRLTKGQVLYVVVGGCPGTTNGKTTTAGGYNGGGARSRAYTNYGSAGGGCTHIGTFNSTLAAHGSTSGLFIVAGGGGGGCHSYNTVQGGGHGGGLTGGGGRIISGSLSMNPSYGGTQSAGGYVADSNTGGVHSESVRGTFGQGGHGETGGGGGLYGGGSGLWYHNPGTGGSGYIGGVSGGSMSSGIQTVHGSASIQFVSL